MSAIRKQARLAGILYLFIVASGLFGLVYVPSRLIVAGDAPATFSRILASPFLFRLDMLNSLVSSVVFLFLALALHDLLKEVDHRLSVLMVVLVVIQVPFAYIDVLNHLLALELAQGHGYLAALSGSQREALGMLFLQVNSLGTIALELFWGFWLFPLGVLVSKSRFLPKVLGVWLWINGLAYVLTCVIGILVPRFLSLANLIAFPFLLGELAFTLGLLLVGFREAPTLPSGASGSLG